MTSDTKMLSACDTPKFGDKVAASQPCEATLDLLLNRRSLVAKEMGFPGPSQDQLKQLLKIASRVPDHGRLVPWRFVIFQDEDSRAYGDILADVFKQENPKAEKSRIEFERDRFSRVPMVIAVVYSPDLEDGVPAWEQMLTSGAVCQNLLIAANAMGFASQWLSEWYAYNGITKKAMGLTKHEEIAGFIYLGSAESKPSERKRPKVKKITQTFGEATRSEPLKKVLKNLGIK